MIIIIIWSEQLQHNILYIINYNIRYGKINEIYKHPGRNRDVNL